MLGTDVADNYMQELNYYSPYARHLKQKLFYMQCNRQTSHAAFFTQMFQPPVKLGIIGAGCSVATEAVAEVAYYYNLTQVCMYQLAII